MGCVLRVGVEGHLLRFLCVSGVSGQCVIWWCGVSLVIEKEHASVLVTNIAKWFAASPPGFLATSSVPAFLWDAFLPRCRDFSAPVQLLPADAPARTRRRAIMCCRPGFGSPIEPVDSEVAAEAAAGATAGPRLLASRVCAEVCSLFQLAWPLTIATVTGFAPRVFMLGMVGHLPNGAVLVGAAGIGSMYSNFAHLMLIRSSTFGIPHKARTADE